MRADSPSFVAQFYTEHRAFIIALQTLGMVDALLLARLRVAITLRRPICCRGRSADGFLRLGPTMITLVLAVVADPAIDTETAAQMEHA